MERAKQTQSERVKYWEIIADNLSKAGWSWGQVSAIDSNRRTIWIADAHRDDGKRFVVRAEKKLTTFLELERSYARFIALPKCRRFGTILLRARNTKSKLHKAMEGLPQKCRK